MRRLLCWLRIAHTPIRVIDKGRLDSADHSTGFAYVIETSHHECLYCHRRLA